MKQRGTRALLGLASFLLPVSVLPLAWWAIGDLTESQVRGRSDLMYMFTPPDFGPATEHSAAIICGIVSVILTGLIIVFVSRIRSPVLSVGIVLALWAIGFGWGLVARTLTIGAYGANMSALILPLVPVLLIGQVLVAVFAARAVRPRVRATAPQPEILGEATNHRSRRN